MNTKFHLAFKVKDIQSTIDFYHNILGCTKGRETENWIDFDFFGHQISAHVSKKTQALDYCGKVENIKVPIPHMGCILERKDFLKIKNNLLKHNIEFIVKPYIRYEGEIGEQQTMFVLDFSNNPIEFKSFTKKGEAFK